MVSIMSSTCEFEGIQIFFSHYYYFIDRMVYQREDVFRVEVGGWLGKCQGSVEVSYYNTPVFAQRSNDTTFQIFGFIVGMFQLLLL